MKERERERAGGGGELNGEGSGVRNEWRNGKGGRWRRCTRKRKEARKGTTVDEATSARTEKKRSTSGAGERGRGGAAATAAAGASAAAAEYTTRPSRVLGGSVCRVAWPIVCKGSRSSSKEPAEEEEEGSEAN